MDHRADRSDGVPRHGLRDVPVGRRPTRAHQTGHRLRGRLRGQVLRAAFRSNRRLRDPVGERPRGTLGTAALRAAVQNGRAPVRALGGNDLEARRLCRKRGARVDERYQELPTGRVGDHSGRQPQARVR
ncbi:MAG: hypothetical protein ACK559_01835, partial [bacterium]